VSRGSGVFFGWKRQYFSTSNSPKKTPDPFVHHRKSPHLLPDWTDSTHLWTVQRIERFSMACIEDVCQVLNELAPLSTAESWDNVGLLLGRRERTVSRLMTCLTLTPAVAQESVARNVELIVTHHPVLFRGAKAIISDTIEGKLLLDLIEAGVAVYSAHTAFDNAERGINEWLGKSLGLTSVEPLRPFADGVAGGAGRKGVFEVAISRQEFLQKLATVVGAAYLEVAWHGPGLVKSVGLACGSAVEYLDDAINSGCETFVTGEARFHSAVECQSRQINLVLTGHFASERPAVMILAKLLAERLPGVDCFASDGDRDPLELFRLP